MSSFIILIFPYILGLISMLIGYFILARYKIKNSFLVGLIFLILSVRPLYDLVDNYIGYYFNHSDFVLASRIVGNSVISIFTVTSMIIGVTLILVLYRKYKQYPKIVFE